MWLHITCRHLIQYFCTNYPLLDPSWMLALFCLHCLSDHGRRCSPRNSWHVRYEVVWEEKHRLSTNAWPTCCLWNMTCPTVPSWVGWDTSCLRNPQIWGPREQILHALCHQRLLRHSPRLVWGLCATGILTVSHQEQNNSKTWHTAEKMLFVYIFTSSVLYNCSFFIKGLAPPYKRTKKWRKKNHLQNTAQQLLHGLIWAKMVSQAISELPSAKNFFWGTMPPDPLHFAQNHYSASLI